MESYSVTLGIFKGDWGGSVFFVHERFLGEEK